MVSGLPDKIVVLSVLEARIVAFVLESWPVSALDVAAHLQVDVSSFEAKKRASAKFSYYLQKLVDKRLLLSKRMGNSLVVWPLEVEKYRAVHAILNSSHGVFLERAQQSVSQLSQEPVSIGPVKGVS